MKERYETLNEQWHNAEEIVTRIDIQRSNYRKISSIVVQPDPSPSEPTTRSTLKSVFSKITFPTFETLERKESNTSNEVFFEVILCSSPSPHISSFQDTPIHTVTIPIEEPTNESSVIIARTHTESVVDRSSPYNIIETSLNEDVDDQNETISPSTSIHSETDVYMDAVDVIIDHQSDGSVTPISYGSFTKEIIHAFAANLHRIDKDVARCDRNYSYFINNDNLKKLRNIMCT